METGASAGSLRSANSEADDEVILGQISARSLRQKVSARVIASQGQGSSADNTDPAL